MNKNYYKACRRLPILALAVYLAGCASANKSALIGGETVSRAPLTIGDLARRDIRLQKQTLDAVPAEQVIDTYRNALSLFSTPEQRADALRRMADITMVATEEQLLGPGLDDTAQPGVDTGNKAAAGINYAKAIELYRNQIESAPPGTDLSDTYYLLAKAYDLNAEPEPALQALDKLARDYPDSPLMDEVQFRRGEQYFLMGRYEESVAAYQAVLRSGPESSYYQNALYKYGWSLYKQGDYDLALDQFVALLDIYLPADSKAKENAGSDTRRQMEEDTLRVTAMSFSNLDGPASIASYFDRKGTRHYEDRLYGALAQLYVGQERYRDAAETYGAFTARHPLHPMAPALSSKKIDVYAKGGFPSLVLEEKQRYVKDYGIYSDYWKQATPEHRNSYGEQLNLHLVEIAQHYHAQAQSGKQPAAYQDAARWYREYLATFPQDKRAPLMNSLLGEALFAGGDYQAAISEFERTAYDYGNHDNARKAGYFALMSYESYLKQLPKNAPDRAGWITKGISSSQRFIKTWPDDAQVPTLYENILDSQLALNDIDGAKATAAQIIKRDPALPRDLYEKAWMVQANAEFDAGNFQSAESSIKNILGFSSLSEAERNIYKDRHAKAIYKQAELLEKEGMKAEAARQYQKVAAAEPDSEVRAKADYDAANLLMETGQHKEAIAVLENFRKVFPDHELAKSVPAKLSVAYEKTGDYAGSARELENIAGSNNDPEIALAALTQAAALHENKGNRKEAIRVYTRLEAQKDIPFAERVDLQHKLAQLNEQDGNTAQRDAWQARIIESWRKGGAQNTERTRYLAAEASFKSAEPQFERYRSLKLNQPLATSIRSKKQAMDDVLAAYAGTAEIGVLQFTTAATYRIGEAYRNFASAIMDSERPTGLADDALEEYELLLEDQALPMEDQAIEIHQANTARLKQGAWDDWIQKSFEALGELQPGRYKKPEQPEDYVDAIF